MNEEQMNDLYEKVCKNFDGMACDDVLVILGNLVADLAYGSSKRGILETLSLLNTTAIVKYNQLIEEEDESTKH